MQTSAQGLVPAGDLEPRFRQALANNHDITHQLQNISWSLIERSPLLDSANIVPADWESIARDCRRYGNMQGLVVVHGTDTLAYTASALAFFLHDFAIPVVITGAQYPLGTGAGDAVDNLSGALLAASNTPAGVWVYFHQQLMPASRVVKKDATSLNGFSAPREALCKQPPSLKMPPTNGPMLSPVSPGGGSLQSAPRNWPDIHIATVLIQPGYSARQFSALLQSKPDAIILSLYGIGTLADLNHPLLTLLEQAIRLDIVLVAVSQCYIGNIDFDVYRTGHALKKLGVLSAADMTLEAAYSKLAVLFRLGYSIADIRQLFVRPIANEMTIECI